VASAGEGVGNPRVIGEAGDKAKVGFVGRGEQVIRRKGVREEGSSKAWGRKTKDSGQEEEAKVRDLAPFLC